MCGVPELNDDWVFKRHHEDGVGARNRCGK
jgi:hypothetical protein